MSQEVKQIQTIALGLDQTQLIEAIEILLGVMRERVAVEKLELPIGLQRYIVAEYENYLAQPAATEDAFQNIAALRASI